MLTSELQLQSINLHLYTHGSVHSPFSFADDLQLQISAPTDKISELLHSMQSCISVIKAWATANMLRVNDKQNRTHACHLQKN